MVKERDETKWVSCPDDLISEDSSFIGDAESKAEFQERAATFNPRDYWNIHAWNSQCVAAQERASWDQRVSLTQTPFRGQKRKREDAGIKQEDTPKAIKAKSEHTVVKRPKTVPSPASTTSAPSLTPPPPPPPSSAPFNPYADDPAAYQLHETISEFIDRLRPSTSTLATAGPWIWIANPHSRARLTDADVGGFKQLAHRLLEKFMQHRRSLEEAHPDKPASSITRMLKADREDLELNIVNLAKSHHLTTGKWMIFPLPRDVDAVWSAIATATREGRLGCSAKVATDTGNAAKPERLICVYTEDFSDVDDVKRVLLEVKEMGFVGKGDGPRNTIYYKCDAYTHLDIMSDNEYRLRASMYSSRDMLGQGGRRKS